MLAIALPTAAEILNGCTEGKGELGKQAVAMDALHEKSVKAFPAPSRGRGNQLMQPRRQGELKIYDLTCSEIDWEEAGRITMHGYTLNG